VTLPPPLVQALREPRVWATISQRHVMATRLVHSASCVPILPLLIMSSSGNNSRGSPFVPTGLLEQPPVSAIRSEPDRDLYLQVASSSRSARVLAATPSIPRPGGGSGSRQGPSADEFRAEWRKLGSEAELGAWRGVSLNVRPLVPLSFARPDL
jgi:hypothetical protein